MFRKWARSQLKTWTCPSPAVDIKWHFCLRITLFATLAPAIWTAWLLFPRPPPPLFMLDIQRGPDNESLCKVWWNSYRGVFFKWTFNVRREICKFSATLAPPISTEWLVTPIFYFGFPRRSDKDNLEQFHGNLIVRYILNEFKWMLSFICNCQLVECLNPGGGGGGTWVFKGVHTLVIKIKRYP